MPKKTGVMILRVAWRGEGGVDNPLHTLSMYSKRRMILLQKVLHPLEIFRENKFFDFFSRSQNFFFFKYDFSKESPTKFAKVQSLFFSIWVSFYLIFINHRAAEGTGQS